MIGDKTEVLTYLDKDKEGDCYEIKRKQKKSIRSLAQIRYYWAVIVSIIGDFHGLTPIETNESLKLLFKKETFTDLDTHEFKFVIETIIELWKTKYQVIIPLPMDSNQEKSLMESLGF